MFKILSITALPLLLLNAAAFGQYETAPFIFDRKVVSTPGVRIPAEAVESGLGGVVRVSVVVDAQGSVVAIGSAAGPGPVCAGVARADVVAMRNAAKEAATSVKFAPVQGDGPALARSWVEFEFRNAEAVDKVSEPLKAAEPAGKDEPNNSAASPRDPNKFTVKGDVNFSASRADYKGPVTVAKDPPATEKYTIVGERNYSTTDSANAAALSGGKTLSGGVLNGKARSLVRPAYPAAARAVRVSGAVSVQVLIDESGKMFSAQAVSGHPLLRPAAVAAACSAEFEPTRLSGEPVKVSGIITYNFVP